MPCRIKVVSDHEKFADEGRPTLWRMLFHPGQDVLRTAVLIPFKKFSSFPLITFLPEVGSDRKRRWRFGFRKGERHEQYGFAARWPRRSDPT